MANPYATPVPPTPRPPDARPLHKRVLVWIGGTTLLIAGTLIGSIGDGGQPPVEAKVKPATTITATVTATTAAEPGPTVTETVTESVKAEAKPGPTVTVTKTATAKAADSDRGSSSGQDSTGTCSIVSNAGNCYSAGQFCRNSDHGAITTTAGGAKIKCTNSSNAWRWAYI
ncbi:hypothetical protein ACKI1I_38985 [Streptomyces turgidiscabies]|uniref:Uncharacterized protein n=1 Tax=Streptomyces turgidiscabies (strain Car8) TaxID=698760 RepID=L7FAS7_STRT8|nr:MULTISPECIES: hypothetical protein [Streptomyces]ELP68234.1 hypothetical protein STRTUCAR8_04184 [Streptomyces turgidiscabies Car8]MDX3496102.1 hypothetical protein [Streptomyces turgidiscabies]GAQ72407.1 hypothetical protein T45_04155 [Streptomyces turgidiscabies]